ncbi:acyl-CoA carboxylase subunit beta [Yunchengibacter salinarum]|uniref:acyl-CoA carboxylase subunit beta n=1 Tax=Yunchengibacter salinarum TaxID=3133399 RepID=UPI0035B67C2C
MPVLQPSLPDSDRRAANRAAHLALIDEVRGLETRIAEVSARARPRFEKRGQLLPRDRLALLLDRGAPFLPLSALAGYRMHDDDGDKSISGGGCIAGIGFVEGVRVAVLVSEAGIKGGAATPMGMQKTLRLQAIALENNLPLIQLVESAGANLFRQSDMFVPGGRTFANLARMSARGLPVISVVHGSSTAGGAYQTGLSDYVIAVRGRARIYLAGPPLLKAATGEVAEEEELGGADMHYHRAGTVDYLAEGDADGLIRARAVVRGLNWDRPAPQRAVAAPLHDPDGLLDLVPVNPKEPYDARGVIAHLVDGSAFEDFRAGYGPHTLTGQARLFGHDVGIIANNGPIDPDGAAKAAQFIQLCCQTGRPVIFLQNTTGFMVGREAEQGGVVKHGSKMIQAVTNMTVPKLTLQIGGAYGAGNYAMCGRAFDPRFIFSWPNARIAVMGGEQAAGTMREVARAGARAKGIEPDEEALAAMADGVIRQYEAESRALFATARLWDDGLIDPRHSRQVLGLALETALEGDRRQPRPSHMGVPRL